MDVGVIIAIVVAAIILIALFAFMSRKAKGKRHEQRRVEARSHREEARVRSARATRAEAEAEERAARAKREQALAEEQAATAERERRFARSKERAAAELDPDGDRTRDPRQERERTHPSR
jgi:FtsZ-interacting cell division protein ZipA